MRRRAVLVASHVNELRAKKATHVLQDFGFGLIFFNIIAIRVNNDGTVVVYYSIYQLFKQAFCHHERQSMVIYHTFIKNCQ